MKPREIDVHIEELVLHGFDARGHRIFADALQSRSSQHIRRRCRHRKSAGGSQI